jgi:transcription elongation GreA/GreB family factor
MDKVDVINALVASLQEELNHSIAASRDAADYATNEEAKAESQWDTQGLEASYLAAGQATQARLWAEALETVQLSRDILLAPKDEITLGALITCDFDGSREHFFMAPVAGGHVLPFDQTEITVITPQSPMASRIIGRRAGEGFTLANGVFGVIVKVS